MKRVEEFAPAKINLALHVTGRREDGYHLLDSLVVFADVGDRVTVEPSETLSMSVTGPRAMGVPTDASNLVLKAAALIPGRGGRIVLDKHLPTASGIGGGSADAAATLRALSRARQMPLPQPDQVLSLGADVPVCLVSEPVRMSGIGEVLIPESGLPPLPAILVNPGVEVSTPAVFTALCRVDNGPIPPVPCTLKSPVAVAAWLAQQRNDLQAPACAIVPAVSPVLTQLEAQAGCLLARMSGSGATCFALFADEDQAVAVAAQLQQRHPEWWVVATTLQ